jgi:hypothetical protein
LSARPCKGKATCRRTMDLCLHSGSVLKYMLKYIVLHGAATFAGKGERKDTGG